MKKILFINIRDFFYQPIPAETLAFFRIAISTFGLISSLILLPDWMWYYSSGGLIPWDVTEPLSTTSFPTLGNVHFILSWLPVSANGVLFGVTTIYILSLIGLMLGYKTRLMGFLAWLMHGLLNTTGHLTAYGVETFTHISLFYCMIFPVGIKWSIDARNKISKIPAYLITLSVRVIQLHLCIMYLSSGIEKACGAQWWNGEAIWIAMQQDQFHKININWMADFPIIPKLLCWSTLLIEGLYPIGIFLKKTSKFWLASILSMHTFIAIFLGLHLFGTLMILLNVSLFGTGILRSKFMEIKAWSQSSGYKFQKLIRIDSIL